MPCIAYPCPYQRVPPLHRYYLPPRAPRSPHQPSLRPPSSYAFALRLLTNHPSLCLTIVNMPSRRAPKQPQQKQQKKLEPPKAPGLIRNPEVTAKIMESILDGPNGKRTLSRLARVSKVLVEPGLGLLWKELDNLVPIISLFPNHLFKRAKRPGLGLAETPSPEHWDKVLQYGERVRRLTYDESSKSVSPSIFPIIDEHRPRTYILPNLTTLVWRVETPSGLDHLHLFLNPELQNLTLEVSPRIPHIGNVLADISRRTKLASFSLTSLAPLPDDIPRLLSTQTELDRFAIIAPGALTSSLGGWVASLERLRALQLDLTGRTGKAVDEFFRHVGALSSGLNSPTSTRSRDSGVFSGEDIDFTEIKKSMKKSKKRSVEERAPIIGAFATLRVLQLTGEVPTIVSFLRRIASPLTHLDLVIEDSFDKNDWRNLCVLLSQSFGDCLQSLKISAGGASRFNDLVRATSRGEAVSRRLSLESFTSLPYLTRLDIDLPESVIIQNSDIAQVAVACPSLEILRLCPTARFPIASGPPSITLDGLAVLTARCRNLETLAVVVDGDAIDPQMYLSRIVSSRTLLKLHLGHSWVREPLAAALALSHLAPHADTLRWFHEKNRPGFIETHALGWQRVLEMLPHLQDVRITERWIAGIPEPAEPRQMVDKGVSVKPTMRDQDIQASPKMANTGTQAVPRTSEKVISAQPSSVSTGVDATPAVVDRVVDAVSSAVEVGVMASPAMVSQEVDAVISEPVDAVPDFSETMYVEDDEEIVTPSRPQPKETTYYLPQIYVPSIVGGAISLAWRTMLFGPNFVTARMQDVWSMTPFHATRSAAAAHIHEKMEDSEGKIVVESEKMSPVVVDSGAGASASGGAGTSTDIVPDMSDTGTGLAGNDITYETHVTDEQQLRKLEPERPEPEKKPEQPELEPKQAPISWLRLAAAEIEAKKGNPNPGRTRQSSGLGHSPLARHTMSESTIGKLHQKDYTPEVDELLPQATSLAQAGQLQEALEKLLALEKQARNGSDLKSTTRLVKAIIELEYNAREYAQLNSSISVLSKKHGQLKGAIQAMVELAMTWLDEIKQRDGTERWLELIETLRTVTEGKLFLETPRARVTLSLAHHHESLYRNPKPKTLPPRDSLITASDLLSDLQVETYSSMERVEKTKFILEQMRLLLEVARLKDTESSKAGKGEKGILNGGEPEWVKLRVQSRKVNEQFLKEPENESIKLQFYDMMVQYGLHNHAYLDVAKNYHKVWETPTIKEDVTGKGKTALEHIIYYVALAPHDNEQSDMMHRLFADPALEKLEIHHNLIKSFINDELMRWPGIVDVFGPFLRKTEVFANDKHWEDLHTRVIEHNVRVIAKYYTRITLVRLTTLLDLTPQEAEDTLCRLVVAGTVWARIDRPSGIVNFRNKRSAEDVMNDWSSDMQKLLGLVEKTWMGVNAAQAAQARVKA